MSARRMLVRLIAPAGALLAALAFATPAYASVNASLTAPSTVLAGQPRSVTSTVTNTDKVAHKIQRVITIRMNGLTAGAVRIGRQNGGELGLHVAGPGTLRGTDETVQLDPATTRRGTFHVAAYSLVFSTQAPTGRAELTVEITEAGQRLTDASRTISVRAGFGAPTPSRTRTLSPEPSISGDPVAAILGQQPTYQPLADDHPVPRSSSGPPWFLYGLGGILLAGGGGLMYWLWWARRDESSETLGVPKAALRRPYGNPAVSAPTALLPAVRPQTPHNLAHPPIPAPRNSGTQPVQGSRPAP